MTNRLCVVCQRTELGPTELQCCVRCLGATRSAVLEIVELYALLPQTIDDHAGASGSVAGGTHGADPPMVGGDAMVLLGPGSDGANQAREIVAALDDAIRHAAPHAVDEYPGDPASVLGELERWDRDWRHTLGLPMPHTPATVVGCAGFLTDHLARMAQQHPAFDEFATDMRRLLAMLHHATRSGEHVEHGVPCLDCGAQLTRRAREPRPCTHQPGKHAVDCDQGGLGDWHCLNRECPRTRYTEADYLLAMAEHWRKHDLDFEVC